MSLDQILKTINIVEYENVAEVIIPVKDLILLRTNILKLQEQLRTTEIAHREAVAVSMKLMAEQMDESILKFEAYA